MLRKCVKRERSPEPRAEEATVQASSDVAAFGCSKEELKEETWIGAERWVFNEFVGASDCDAGSVFVQVRGMAKKMILIDPRMVPQQPLSPPVPDPLPDVLRRLDGDMEAILHTPNLGLSEKVLRYNEVLSDYLNKTKDYRHRATPPPPPPPTSVPSAVEVSRAAAVSGDVEKEGEGGRKESEVLRLISGKYQPKARRLLSFLSSRPEVTWTDRGELKVGQRVYEGSHIVDLVSQSVKPASAVSVKSVVGWPAFVDLLKKWNVPQDLVSSAVHSEWSREMPGVSPTWSDSSPPVRKRQRQRVESSPIESGFTWSPLSTRGGKKKVQRKK